MTQILFNQALEVMIGIRSMFDKALSATLLHRYVCYFVNIYVVVLLLLLFLFYFYYYFIIFFYFVSSNTTDMSAQALKEKSATLDEKITHL